MDTRNVLSMVLMTVCYILILCGAGVISLPFGELCGNKRDGSLLPHPDSCEYFVECYVGTGIEKKCSQGLHFNARLGICDFPVSASCSKGVPANDGFEPEVIRKSALEYQAPIYKNAFPVDKFTKPNVIKEYKVPQTNPARIPASRKPGYEETIYGVSSNQGRVNLKASNLKDYIQQAIEDSMGFVQERLRDEASVAHKMIGVVDSGPFQYVSAFMGAKPYVKYLSLSGMFILRSLKLIKNKYQLKTEQLFDIVSDVSYLPPLQPVQEVYEPDAPMPIPGSYELCPYPRNFACNPDSPFRTMDGTCNNLQDPILGRSLTPFRRLVPAVYGDGIEEMRLSVTGAPLPGARSVSVHLFPDQDHPESTRTLLVMTFGQFIDHDLTRTAITKLAMDTVHFDTKNMDDVKCGSDGCDSNKPGLEPCWPIAIPDEEPDFLYNKCLKFVRSQEVPPLSCHYGPREQLNQVTAWLDASMIYGSTLEESKLLRDLSDPARGRLLVTKHPKGSYYKPLLPYMDEALCRGVNSTVRCFAAGDERVNENAQLTVVHIIFVREHNRIEEELHAINPHWDGERLFQETRHIISGVFQHIVFNEYLPSVLPKYIRTQYDLILQPTGYYTAYDPTLDPSAPNAFATAAFRFGHTLIHKKVPRVDSSYNHDDSMFLTETLRRPASLYDTSRGGVDSMLRGLTEQACQTFDQFITKQVSRSLFTERPPNGLGMDLMSLNIQRGRDHGLAGYNKYREFCGLKRAYNFEDLATEIKDRRALRMLQTIYRHPDDIDLFAGGVSETVLPDASVGPTFACIIAEYFRNLRRGDRFWYENDGPQRFPPDQLQEIRKVKFGRVMCENGDRVEMITPHVFFHSANDYVPQLNSFKDNQYFIDSALFEPVDEIPPFFDRMANEFPKLRELPTPVSYNIRVPCNTLPTIDLRKWRERPYHK